MIWRPYPSPGPRGQTWRPASAAGDLNFGATSTLTQRDQIGLPQLFQWELQAIRPIGAKIVVKRPQLFTTGTDFPRTIVRKSRSQTLLERGTGLEPATSTLGRLFSRDGLFSRFYAIIAC